MRPSNRGASNAWAFSSTRTLKSVQVPAVAPTQSCKSKASSWLLTVTHIQRLAAKNGSGGIAGSVFFVEMYISYFPSVLPSKSVNPVCICLLPCVLYTASPSRSTIATDSCYPQRPIPRLENRGSLRPVLRPFFVFGRWPLKGKSELRTAAGREILRQEFFESYGWT